MAIAVLISSPAETERFTAIALDLASRLDSPVALLCLKPSPPDEKKKNDSDDKSKVRPEKAKTDKPEDGAPADGPTAFSIASSYVDAARGHTAKHLATMAFGFVLNDVFEVPCQIDELRKWILAGHESPQLGNFEIDTLVIPTMRGAGLEHARELKDRLFEASQIETVYISVDQELTGRLPLNHVGVTGQTQNDVLNASRFARQLSNTQVLRWNAEERDPEQNTVLVAIPGKGAKTRVDNNSTWKALRKDASLPVAMILNPADSLGDRLHSAIDDKMRVWFNAYQLSREDRVKLSAKLEASAESSPEFILFMSVATFLACIGLIQDSAAVIIGAMLVAPLMTPLLGAGLAMIFGNKPLFGKALRSILLYRTAHGRHASRFPGASIPRVGVRILHHPGGSDPAADVPAAGLVLAPQNSRAIRSSMSHRPLPFRSIIQ